MVWLPWTFRGAEGIPHGSHWEPDIRPGDLVAAMSGTANLERTEGSGRRHPGLADAIDKGCGRPLAELREQGLQAIPRPFGDAMDRPVRVVRDPADEPKSSGLSKHEVPIAHAVDAAADPDVEALVHGWGGVKAGRGVRRRRRRAARPGPGRPGSAPGRRSRRAAQPIERPVRGSW